MKACRTVIQRALEPVHSEKVLTQVIAAGRAERAGAAWHDEGSYNPRSHPRTIRAGAKYFRDKGCLRAFVWARNADEMAAWLLTGKGTIVVGTNWYFGMSNIGERAIAKPTGAVLGGHAYLVIGYNRVTMRFRCLNSWGREFGKNGRFWIEHEDMHRLIYKERGEACAATEMVEVVR